MKRVICFSILLILLLPFTFVGYLYAGPPKKIVNAFTYCYDGKDTGIEKLLDIDGYFSELYICGERKSYTNLIFYSNGIVATSMRVLDNQQEPYDEKTWDLNLALSRISSDENKKESESFYRGEWGRYIIEDNIIKIQHIYKPFKGQIGGWIGWETWYKVVDRKTIKVIKQRQLWKLDYYDFTQSQVDEYCRRVTATFKPLSVKPRFDKTWIFKEKWFWCNENDWKEFMKTTEDKK